MDEDQRDPVIEAYEKHVDRTLLRRNLQLNHEERLLQLQQMQRLAEELRRGQRAAPPASQDVIQFDKIT